MKVILSTKCILQNPRRSCHCRWSRLPPTSLTILTFISILRAVCRSSGTQVLAEQNNWTSQGSYRKAAVKFKPYHLKFFIYKSTTASINYAHRIDTPHLYGGNAAMSKRIAIFIVPLQESCSNLKSWYDTIIYHTSLSIFVVISGGAYTNNIRRRPQPLSLSFTVLSTSLSSPISEIR